MGTLCFFSLYSFKSLQSILTAISCEVGGRSVCKQSYLPNALSIILITNIKKGKQCLIPYAMLLESMNLCTFEVCNTVI